MNIIGNYGEKGYSAERSKAVQEEIYVVLKRG